MEASSTVNLDAQVEILAALDIVNHKEKDGRSDTVDEKAYNKHLCMGSSISTSDNATRVGL